MSSDILFVTFLYFLVCLGVIYPPQEFIVVGLSVERLGSSYLGSELVDFLDYHIRRTILTLSIFASLPLGYICLLWTAYYLQEIPTSELCHPLWQIYTAISLILPAIAYYQIKKWSQENYKHHPIVVNLSQFCNNNSSWTSIASDINNEYRGDKFSVKCSAIHRVIATSNWIMKITPLSIQFAHQSDARLVVDQSDTHLINETNSGLVQFVNILVSQTGRSNFYIRLNVDDFKDLQNQITRTITVLPEIKLHKSLADKFVDAFKEVAAENPRYHTEQVPESCIGCMQATANVKLQKLCTSQGENGCAACYCRPMWCVECLAKWFAYRQDQSNPNTWLASKCSCPMCRAQFCLLDVCFVDDE